MKRFLLILTIGWMCFIFYQGSRQLSDSYHNSDVVVNKVVSLIENLYEKVNPNSSQEMIITSQRRAKLAYLIRKSAHFFEYGALAALLIIVFYLLKQSSLNRVVYSLFITLLCAVMDEFYQSFINRGSRVQDIIIDFSGTLVGTIFVVIGMKIFAKIKIKKERGSVS